MPRPYSREDLDRKILIHVCKDRTLTYRNRLQPIFNGVAIPIFSVDSVDEARMLIRTVSVAQYEEHPQAPGDTWYKISLGADVVYLDDDLHQLDDVKEKLRDAYEYMKAREAEDRARFRSAMGMDQSKVVSGA